MLAWLRKNRARRQSARLLYGSIVTAARQPIFYAELGAPDTVAGRFEMILLHLALAQHRLLREGKEGARLARGLAEVFVADMDDALREMTIGDLAVPREIKRATAALFDRWRAYGQALGTDAERRLERVLEGEIAYLDRDRCIDSPALAAYMRRARAALDRQPGVEILAGALAWPAPPARSREQPRRVERPGGPAPREDLQAPSTGAKCPHDTGKQSR